MLDDTQMQLLTDHIKKNKGQKIVIEAWNASQIKIEERIAKIMKQKTKDKCNI